MEQHQSYTHRKEDSLFYRTVQMMAECEDVTIPLLERLKRLEVIRDKMPLLSVDSENLNNLLVKLEHCFLQIITQLMAQSVFYLEYDDLTASEEAVISDFYHHSIVPLLQPQIVKTSPIPSSCIAALLNYQKSSYLGIVTRPAAIPDYYVFSAKPIRLIPMASILLHYLDEQFPGYTCAERVSISFCANACRPMLSASVSEQFMQAILPQQSALVFSMPHGSLLQALQEALPISQKVALSYPALTFNDNHVVTNRRSVLLPYPQEKADIVEQLIRESASDPAVCSILVSGVLSSAHSQMLTHLCRAARGGIQVSVMSPFLNEDSIHTLEEAGCIRLYQHISASFILITRLRHGRYTTSVVFSTESSDVEHSPNSFRLVMYMPNGRDFLRNLPLPKEYIAESSPQHPTIEEIFFSLIDEQILLEHRGFIFLKTRELTNPVFMQKLRDASCAGVQIFLLVSDLCCLLPGVPGETEHIQVYSTSGALDDNTAFVCFGAQPNSKIFLLPFSWRKTSAPPMLCPVQQNDLAEKLSNIFHHFFVSSTTLIWQMKSDGAYTRATPDAVLEALRLCCPQKVFPRKRSICRLLGSK